MFYTSTAWIIIDRIEELLFWRDCHGDVKQSLVIALQKAYVVAWLDSQMNRQREGLLARIALSESLIALPAEIATDVFTTKRNQEGY